MPYQRIQLILLSLCHLLVDGICATVLINDPGDAAWAASLLLYNTMAFSTQCLTGMLPDKYGRGESFVLLSALLLAVGAAGASLPLLLRSVFLGLGNSLFHVSGGYITLKESDNMTPLGIFVSPGAVGLFLGGTFPGLRIPFMGLLMLLAGLLALGAEKRGKEERSSGEKPGIQAPVLPEDSLTWKGAALYAGFLLLAIAARALGGAAVSFPWKNGLLPALLLTLAVFLGKCSGGFLADRFGIKKIALLSAPLAMILTAFCGQWMLPSLLGQWALNLSMPITLYLIYRLYPNSPGFAFGLAASALWPGVLLGNIVRPSGFWAPLMVLVCLGTGLAAILLTERRLTHEKN
ncbi:MAG: hypothetical protein IJR95_05575 [Lachnospiraceae bacterium]|nr:hypothetical protein [Lachnospiraceae bacterium]